MKISSLEQHNCYDILPRSFKVIVFDRTLLVKKALAALLQHGVPSAPVWDSAQHKFVGMLTGNPVNLNKKSLILFSLYCIILIDPCLSIKLYRRLTN
jgi:hypothetical protein